MEMANCILQIFKLNLAVVWSWGFNSPKALRGGLKFHVEGFKYKGIVAVVYDEGADLFDVRLVGVAKTIQGVFFDQLVEVIDSEVEKVADYERKVKAAYSLL